MPAGGVVAVVAVLQPAKVSAMSARCQRSVSKAAASVRLPWHAYMRVRLCVYGGQPMAHASVDLGPLDSRRFCSRPRQGPCRSTAVPASFARIAWSVRLIRPILTHPIRATALTGPRSENRMRPRSGLSTCCALALVVALAACGKGGKAQGGPGGPGAGQGDRPTPVTAEQVHLRPWNDTVQALGNVKARESIVVSAKVSEIVQAVHFDSGDHVAAGASLITLSGKAQLAALAQAEATAKEAEQLLKRQTELAAQQLIARSALDTDRKSVV